MTFPFLKLGPPNPIPPHLENTTQVADSFWGGPQGDKS